MNKSSKIIIFLVIVILVVSAVFVVRAKENELLKRVEGKMVYFFGEGCPHCANVKKFFGENNIEDKIQFEKKEVYSDRGNAKLLILLAKRKCGFKENEIGVPLLWDGENSKCIVGDQPIIDYFKEKIVGKL